MTPTTDRIPPETAKSITGQLAEFSSANRPTAADLSWIAPTRPYGIIDALNRRAAATGSPGYAMATSSASYNGHYVTVGWNDYRRYYITQYWWGGRVVLARGTFENCLRAAMNYYDRGDLGAKVSVGIREGDDEAVEIARATPGLTREADKPESTWNTWRHQLAAQSVRDSANPGMIVMHFDLELIETAADEDKYKQALTQKYGRVYC